MDNLELYLKYAAVPANAQKKISGGKLSGMTDINPMWRIKCLTETFGPCGIGWYTELLDRWRDDCDNESAAWVRIRLYVKFPGSAEWSKPIEGIGGSKLSGKGKGSGIDDEAFKMAETDAISVACKKLGFGADVYWANGATKYSAAPTERNTANQAATPARQKDMTMARTPDELKSGSLESLALDDALNDVAAARTPDELTGAWNRWKSAFGKNSAFVKAIAEHPQNPRKGRSNG